MVIYKVFVPLSLTSKKGFALLVVLQIKKFRVPYRVLALYMLKDDFFSRIDTGAIGMPQN